MRSSNYNAARFGRRGTDPMSATSSGGIPISRIATVFDAERTAYVDRHPRSLQRTGQGIAGFYDGVPMHWMKDWSMPFPFLVQEALGSVLRDIDGDEYADFCLGATGSMFGHSPAPVVEAIRRQAGRGLTYMLPTEDALAVGVLLVERFGLPHWQIATTATDANRFALRVARAVTGRPKVLVFNGCYHGTVDETYLRLVDGNPVNRPGLLGQPNDLTQFARIVEFNSVAALEGALSHGDVACVIAEPVLTNSCMVLPQPGFHDELRRMTRRTGTLLLIDETHTILDWPRAAMPRAHGLEPDLTVLGKPIAGGVPANV
jgi:glutamate-1-semialdehyde 2,1-aminomutase